MPTPLSRAGRSGVVALAAGLLLAAFLVVDRSGPEPRMEAASAARFTPTTGAVFNRPVGSRSQQTRIFGYLDKAIDSAPRGSVIRFAVYSFTWKPTADALIRAYRRGVHVQLVFDSHTVYSQETRLRRVLGKDPRRGSFVTLCQGTCRGTTRDDMHLKVFLFSTAGSAHQVVMVGSDNLTAHNAEDQWSDLYTVVGDAPLYWMYAGMFDQLKYDRAVPSPFIDATVDGYGVQVFPRPGTTKTTDPLSRILSKVDCNRPAADGSQVLDSNGKPVVTSVRLSQHAWNGTRGRYLAEQVAGLEEQGCRVYVIYGVGMGGAVKSILGNAGVALNGGHVTGVRTHQKSLTVAGIYDGDPDARIVWTGSHNWSDGALRRDDTIFEVSGVGAYHQYLLNFNDVWAHG